MCSRLAKIHFGAGAAAGLHDHGYLGWRRESGGGILEVPPQFTIIFAPDYSRQCRLRWRIGCEFGAEFTD